MQKTTLSYFLLYSSLTLTGCSKKTAYSVGNKPKRNLTESSHNVTSKPRRSLTESSHNVTNRPRRSLSEFSFGLFQENIHTIAASGNVQNAKNYLENNKHSVNVLDKKNNTALHIAVKYNHLLMVKTLLAYGINVNKTNVKGETALHLATTAYNNLLIDILLAYGARVNAVNKEGRTALHLAAIHKTTTEVTVDYLYIHGADINIKDKDGLTAQELAKRNGNDTVYNLLLHIQKEYLTFRRYRLTKH